MRPCNKWGPHGGRCVKKILAPNQNILKPQNQVQKNVSVLAF